MRLITAGTAAFCFGLLVALVPGGALHHLDAVAVQHWMPWLSAQDHHPTSLRDLTLPEGQRGAGGTLLSVWTYPASVLPSALLVFAAAVSLRRQGRLREAVGWPTAWLAGNVVEVVVKHAVARPALVLHMHGVAYHLAASTTRCRAGTRFAR